VEGESVETELGAITAIVSAVPEDFAMLLRAFADLSATKTGPSTSRSERAIA
jgi:hypothetical protein